MTKKVKKVEQVVNVVETAKVIAADESRSKSKRMIAMFDLGLGIKEIADIMGTRYNFVYNVCSNYCNMNDKEMPTGKSGPSKKDEIVKRLAEGKSLVDISRELKCQYNYVFNVRKSLEVANKKEVAANV